MSKQSSKKKPWELPMPDAQFALMKRIIEAPTPVGFEAAMTGIIANEAATFARAEWTIHRFSGTAGIVIDTMPHARADVPSVLFIGHADKIRMQVRSVGRDGKIWVQTDSMLPSTPVGQHVSLFSEDPKMPGTWRKIKGGTVEAYGAVHLAAAGLRDGSAGVKKKEVYLDLQIWGDKPEEQIDALGIRPGDPIIFDAPVQHGFSPQTFVGAYLDNALGCFSVLEIMRLLAANPVKGVRVLGGIATHEEIGMMGGPIFARQFEPLVVVGVDVNHDYVGTPHQSAENHQPLAMGKGFTISAGSVATPSLNSLFFEVANALEIPVQIDVVGRITGTDAMAGFMAAIDAAATSIGFAVRNMHSVTETGHTGDVLAAIHACDGLVRLMDRLGIGPAFFRAAHPELSEATLLEWTKPKPEKKGGAKKAN